MVICIENPRVPGSIPGRGTIIQKALHENAGLFLFAQRSWQTRQVERNLNHPDWGEDNPNGKGVVGQRQGPKEAIGS